MAEAHLAVAFSFQVTHEGVHINYDTELLHAVWLSGLRSWRNRFARFARNFQNGVYPASLELLFAVQALVLGLHFALNKDPLGLIRWAANQIAPLFGALLSRAVVCLALGFLLFILKSLFLRYALKLLLLYKGWMFESRSRQGPSRRTRLWYALVRMLTRKQPSLYSYQASLPRLPLPPLERTVERYLRSVRPLLDEKEFARMSALAEEFRDGIGRKFQRYLLLKAWWASNYVSDWWEEFVYLRGRAPLMVNSNFYGIDALQQLATQKPAARAANLTYACLLFRKQIDRQELKPILVQGLVPLCSFQYERLFNTTRIPGPEADSLRHLLDSPHIVVLSRGKIFKLQIHHKGRLLQPRDLQRQFQRIIDDQSEATPPERHLAALTAAERGFWARVRRTHFRKGLNRISLAAIESAAFAVVLDDCSLEYDSEEALDNYGQMLLHGNGDDRWYDKSFNLIVAKNARVGFNAEHSWADAPIMAHLWEHALHQDFAVLGYDNNGDCRVGSQEDSGQSQPIRLKWDVESEELQSALNSAFQDAQLLLRDVDLRLFRHSHFGKGFIKRCQVSPDAFIQMALQLAYRRDQGRLSLTYEASMTRLFREGRTETVRPVTMESKAFVDAIVQLAENQNQKDKDSQSEAEAKKECVRLLREACARHQRGYQEAMCGRGVDRHLFCLYVISKYLETDSPFLKQVLSEPWKLSTSQTPHGQVGLLAPTAVSAGGGFGPVADDGYGVSYIVAGEHEIFFHISSKKSSPATDSARFRDHVERALQDMRALFE